MLLNTRCVGGVLGWQPVTVARKLRSGEIPGGVKHNRRWGLPDDAFEAYLSRVYPGGMSAGRVHEGGSGRSRVKL